MSKVYIITKETVDHLGQTVRYTGAVDECFLHMALIYAELEGYTVVSVEERQ